MQNKGRLEEMLKEKYYLVRPVLVFGHLAILTSFSACFWSLSLLSLGCNPRRNSVEGRFRSRRRNGLVRFGGIKCRKKTEEKEIFERQEVRCTNHKGSNVLGNELKMRD